MVNANIPIFNKDIPFNEGYSDFIHDQRLLGPHLIQDGEEVELEEELCEHIFITTFVCTMCLSHQSSYDPLRTRLMLPPTRIPPQLRFSLAEMVKTSTIQS